MMESFKLLTEYSVYLIEKKHFEKTFGFYNYVFEKYFPENNSNLDNIDYDKLFIGKYTHETTDIYKRLLDLWIELQDKCLLGKENILKLRIIENKINRIFSEYY